MSWGVLEEALEVTIASGAPILHGIALRFEHKNLHFVINDFIKLIYYLNLPHYNPCYSRYHHHL